MTKETKKSTERKPIPEFASREEEAKFWDTHSIADYWDEMTPVQVTFKKPLTAGLTLRLDASTLTGIQRLAAEKGIGPTTLARMWLIERLKQEASVHHHA